MICFNCNTSLPDGAQACHYCGQPVSAAIPYAAPYNQQKQGKISLNPQVRGTGFVILLSLVAWLIAVLGPVISLTRLVRGLIAHIIFMLGELGYNIMESFVLGFGEIVSLFFVMIFDQYNVSDKIAELLGLDIAFSNVSNFIEVIFNVSGALVRGSTPLSIGMILPSIILIPLIIMFAVFKKNVRASKVLLIINSFLCILGNIMCFTVIKNVFDALGTVQPPYHNISFVTLLLVIIGAVLWIASIIYYFILAGKSSQMSAQYMPAPIQGAYMPPPNDPAYYQQQPAYQPPDQQQVYQQQQAYQQADQQQPVYQQPPAYPQQPVYQQPPTNLQQPINPQQPVCKSCGNPCSGKFCAYCGASNE